MSTRQIRAQIPMADINVTPMVDVMLVLLIIFMITAPVLSHQISIDLPHGVPPDRIKVEPPTPIDLRITASGELFWNSQALIAEALEPQLRLEVAKAAPTELRIDADFATPYQTVANVLATAKRVRVEKIGFKSLAR
ncbi:MAG: biopolymer transporter ExbD [Lysobacterales bacterium]